MSYVQVLYAFLTLIVVPAIFITPFLGIILFYIFSQKLKIKLTKDQSMIFAFVWMVIRVIIFFPIIDILPVPYERSRNEFDVFVSFIHWCLPAVITAIPEIFILKRMSKTSTVTATKVVLFSLIPATIYTFMIVFWFSSSCYNSYGC